MNIRLQVLEGKNSNDVLKQGFISLSHYCDILDSNLDLAIKKYNKK